METKICRVCGQEKTIDQFNKDRRQSDGYATICRECKHKKDKEYYDKCMADPEKHAKRLQQSREYKARNKDKVQAAWEEYNKRPEVIQRKAEWHQNKKETMSIEDKLKEISHRAHSRALLKNVPCTITWKDIQYREICPILGIKLNWGFTTNEGGRNIDTPSLDRIDPRLGYIPGNICIISTLANMMKSSANREQIQLFCNNIFKYLDKEDIVRPTENKESVELEDKEPLS